MQDHDLDALFAAARAAPAAPSDALMARVMADALDQQPKARTSPVAPAPTPAPTPARGRRFWEPVAALFGGVPALAGMGGAAVAGVLIGYVQPVGLATLSDALTGATVESLQLMPSVDPLLDEVTQ